MKTLIKAIIFDFDGVILDDAYIKEDAFKYLFPNEFNDIVMPILEKYARQSRKIIIQQCMAAIQLKHELAFDYEYYLNKYYNLTQEAILSSPENKTFAAAHIILDRKGRGITTD